MIDKKSMPKYKLSREAQEWLDKYNIKKRVPAGQPGDAIHLEGQNPSLHYRIVNDDPARIEKLKRGGWALADKFNSPNLVIGDGARPNPKNASTGSSFAQVVDRYGKRAYVMCIPEEIFQMDKEEKRRNLKRMLNEELMPKNSGDSEGEEVVELPSNIRKVLDVET